MNPIFIIAKKEFMDNFRNYWIFCLSILFAIFVVLASYFSSYGQGLQDFDVTIQAMVLPVQFLITIIGLMLGYAAISVEIESGSMGSLLAHPITRFEVLIGKFIGLASVIILTIILGFGIAGIIVAINVNNPDYLHYLTFIFTTILLGLAFISISLLFSSFCKNRSKSMNAAIFYWIFFVGLYPMITGVILIITKTNANSASYPAWYYISQFFDPAMIYANISNPYAGSLSPNWITLSLLTWIVFPLMISNWIFKKQDI
jgi:Cu-processing system permease protein